ncbi:MAG TPA: GNAT family N-acetyltransferase [Candidatus Hydrogenedentes bacterium]|nr:GNAT family N-acetyltransferase [Candidatus Hydrogenedentota bacterium]
MSDLSAVFKRTSDPEVMRFHDGPLNLEAARDGLERIILNAVRMLPFGIRFVIVKKNNENVGYCYLGPGHRLGSLSRLEDDPIEISYDIVRDSWNSGYATEAACRLIQHGFEDLALPEIFGFVHPRNIASFRVLQKLGFVKREKAEWPNQGLVDLCSITREKYESWRKANPAHESTT